MRFFEDLAYSTLQMHIALNFFKQNINFNLIFCELIRKKAILIKNYRMKSIQMKHGNVATQHKLLNEKIANSAILDIVRKRWGHTKKLRMYKLVQMRQKTNVKAWRKKVCHITDRFRKICIEFIRYFYQFDSPILSTNFSQFSN